MRTSLRSRRAAGTLLAWLAAAALLVGCGESSARRYDPLLTRAIQAGVETSAWEFETIYHPRQFDRASLALDAAGNPHLAYGGSQLYYAWSDGAQWHAETPDPSPGAGKNALVVLDAAGSPHFIHERGTLVQTELVHTYPTQAGWQHEIVSADFCFKEAAAARFDPQGRLVVLYSGSTSCTRSDFATNHLWYARLEDGEWDISVLSRSGLNPSLAFDPTGQPHVTYLDTSLGSLVESAWNGQAWEGNLLDGRRSDNASSLTLFDPGGTQHILVIRAKAGQTGNTVPVEHAWKDSSGWHSEILGEVAQASSFLEARFDEQGQLSLLVWDAAGEILSLVQRGPSPVIPTRIRVDEQPLSAPAAQFDREGQLHLAYLTRPDSLLHYASQQPQGWETVEIDRSDQLAWYPGALAFDRAGRLAVAAYARDNTVRYLSQKNGAWDAETVGKGLDISGDAPIDLLFDLDNRAHVFYLSAGADSAGETAGGRHAVLGPGGWETEPLPEKLGLDWTWSAPILAPEGQPVFFMKDYRREAADSSFYFRAPAGWEERSLAEWFLPVGVGLPQIAYPPGPPFAALPGEAVSLPAVAYTTGDDHAAAYFDPREGKAELLPILKKNEEAAAYALAFDPRGQAVVFVTAAEAAADGLRSPGQLIVAARAESGWKAYRITNFDPANMTRPAIDSQGWIHFAFRVNDSRGTAVYAAAGRGAEWQLTRVTGAAANPETVVLVGAALDQETGTFCIALADIRSNALNVGCDKD